MVRAYSLIMRELAFWEGKKKYVKCYDKKCRRALQKYYETLCLLANKLTNNSLKAR